MVNGRTEAEDMAREHELATIRDTFAAASLTGLLSHGYCAEADECVPIAYALADAMLRERNGAVEGCETVQSDHIPDAGKMVETPGEIEKYRRFIGEVMNWISEATGFLHDDVLRTDDARDVITDACSKCWGAFDRIAYPSTNHDAVPEAKADLPDECPPNAVSANGGTPGAASRDGSGTGGTKVGVSATGAESGSTPDAQGFGRSNEYPCQPFDSAPTTCPHVRGTVTQHCSLNFTLTDEEREALKEGADSLYGDGYDAEAATLRNLLERLHT